MTGVQGRTSRGRVAWPVLGAAAGAALVAGSGRVALVAGAVGGLAFLTLTSFRTKVLTYFALLPFVFWMESELSVPNARLLPALIAYAAAAHLVWEMATHRARLTIDRVLVMAIGLYVAFIIVQCLNPIALDNGVSFTGARIYLEPMLLFLIGLHYFRGDEDAQRFLRLVVVTGLLVGLYMLKQLVFGFSASEIAAHSDRFSRVIPEQKLFSTFANPDSFGFASAFFTLAALSARRTGWRPLLCSVVAALSALGVLTSGSRISLVALLVAGALLLLLQLQDPVTRLFSARLAAFAVAAVVAIGALVIVTPAGNRNDTIRAANPAEAAIKRLALLKQGTTDEDFASRADRLSKFVDYMTAQPLGAGPGVVGLVSGATILKPTQTEQPKLPFYLSSATWAFQHDFYYVAVGIELGLVPLLLFIGLLISGLVMSVRAWRRSRDPGCRAVLVLAASALVLVLIQNATNESFRAPQVAGYIWFLLAAPVAFGLPRSHRRGDLAAERTDEPAPHAG
jgi:hypothetical protein